MKQYSGAFLFLINVANPDTALFILSKANAKTEVKLTMTVFNASHGILRWSAFFALHFWRLRLKISRIGA